MAAPSAVLSAMVRVNAEKGIRELKRFDRVLRQTDKTTVSATVKQKEFSKASDDTSKSMDRTTKSAHGLNTGMINVNQGFTSVRNSAGLIKWPAIISGVTYAAEGANALAAGTSAVAGSLSSLAGLAAPAISAYTALGQAAGVVALSGVSDLGTAIGGLNEKLDESSTEFKQLSPQAQEFARTLNQLKGPIREIQGDVQQPLFAGMNQGLRAARENLPALRKVLEATAQSMGDLARRAGEFAGRQGFGRDFEAIGKTNARLLGRMGDAGLNFADALRHVLVAARPLTNWLGNVVVQMSEYVKNSARAGRESGDLARFFEQTKTTLKIIGPLLGDFAKGLWNVIQLGRPLGNDILRSLRESAEEFRKWTESARGRNAITEWYENARPALFELGKLIRDVGAAFFDLGDDKGLANLIRTLRKEVLPVIVDVLKAGRGFGPVFVDFAVQAMKAFRPFLGANGALTLMVKGLTGILRVFNDLIEAVPALGVVLSNVLTGAAILGLFKKLSGRFGGLGTELGSKIGMGMKVGLAGIGIAAVIINELDRADEIIREKSREWGRDISGALAGPATGVLPSLTAEALKVGKLDQYIAKMKQVGTVIDVSMVRGWVAAGKVTVAQGAKIIRTIKDTQQAAARARKDIAEDEGFGLARQMALDGKMLPQEINKAMQRLDALPPKMRKFAIESMVHFTAGLEACGPVAQGRHRQADRSARGPLGRAAEEGRQPGPEARRRGEEGHRPRGGHLRALRPRRGDGRRALVKEGHQRLGVGLRQGRRSGRDQGRQVPQQRRPVLLGWRQRERRRDGPHGRRDQQDAEVTRRREGQGRLRRQVRKDGRDLGRRRRCRAPEGRDHGPRRRHVATR